MNYFFQVQPGTSDVIILRHHERETDHCRIVPLSTHHHMAAQPTIDASTTYGVVHQPIVAMTTHGVRSEPSTSKTNHCVASATLKV
ncbi:MAG TPA: hypothetical protein VIM11_25715 [Tepidisphaeraceae bacterium]